jgi:molecular chaperone GrpE
MADEKKESVGYVPDENSQEDDEKKIEEKNSFDDASLKKKNAGKKLQHKVQELEEKLHKITAERDELKDKLLRGLAEIDNFRKRMKKEKEEYQKYVLREFLLDVLPIYDNLERALKAKSLDNEKGIISGVEMIRKQFLDLLRKNNVVEIDSLGKQFDPTIHDAFGKEEREGITQPVVIEIYQKGFTYNEKLLRPALTKVAIPIVKDDFPASEPKP